MLIVYARKLPESLPPERRQPLNARNILHGYRTVIGSAQFVRVSLAHGLNWVAMFIYVAGGAQFLVTLLGRSVTEMYLIFGPVMAAMSLGFATLPRWLKRFGVVGTMRISYGFFLLAILLNLGLAWTVPRTWPICFPSRWARMPSACPCHCSWVMRSSPWATTPAWPHRPRCSFSSPSWRWVRA